MTFLSDFDSSSSLSSSSLSLPYPTLEPLKSLKQVLNFKPVKTKRFEERLNI